MQKIGERVAEKNKKSDNQTENSFQIADYQVFISKKIFLFSDKVNLSRELNTKFFFDGCLYLLR